MDADRFSALLARGTCDCGTRTIVLFTEIHGSVDQAKCGVCKKYCIVEEDSRHWDTLPTQLVRDARR